ncbi:MAG: hypothetical protein ACLQBD_13810, partial [Syntrophobacteraceae bacterium]
VAKAATGGRFAPNGKGEVRFESFFKLQETAGKYRGPTQKQKPRRARVRPRKSPPASVDPQRQSPGRPGECRSRLVEIPGNL